MVTHKEQNKRYVTLPERQGVQRELYVIESPPCFIEQAREKIIVPMTEKEVTAARQERPELIVRLATDAEKWKVDIL